MVKLTDQIRRPAALPDHRIAKGLSAFPVPGRRSFPLVGNADYSHFTGFYSRFFQGQPYRFYRIVIDFLKIMGHPAFFVDYLTMGNIGTAEQCSLPVPNQALSSGGALID